MSITTDPPTFRFAPSPNGFLHLGHVRSAAVGFAWARRLGGRFLLRIEDIDLARSRPEFVIAILEDLGWLGFAWDGPVVHQAERFDLYRAAIRELDALGVLYPCFATRRDIAAAVAASGEKTVDPDGAPLYPREALSIPSDEAASRIAAGEPHALRIDMARALAVVADRLDSAALTFREIAGDGAVTDIVARPERWGDAVIVRKDVPASYHLAVVVDDAAQGVTHVTRGMDLYPATDLQRLIQVLLGLPEPRYHHHDLITDEFGRKLSKSAGDTSIRSLRSAGVRPEDIWAQIGFFSQGDKCERDQITNC